MDFMTKLQLLNAIGHKISIKWNIICW
jgi:hypothetical protein